VGLVALRAAHARVLRAIRRRARLAHAVASFDVTKERRCCASCHVMTPYAEDAASLESRSLASIHSKRHRKS
jgi:hypothetical protein